MQLSSVSLEIHHKVQAQQVCIHMIISLTGLLLHIVGGSMPFSIQGSKTPQRRTLAVNAEKLKEPVSPVMPEVLSSWVSAQASVHQNEVYQVDHRDRHLL